MLFVLVTLLSTPTGCVFICYYHLFYSVQLGLLVVCTLTGLMTLELT